MKKTVLMLMAFCVCVVAKSQVRETDIGNATINQASSLSSSNVGKSVSDVQPLASTTVYIQNETVSGSKTYSADLIKVGSSVTNSKPQGDVVFNGGTIILSGDKVEIHPKTTVIFGTRFELRAN